MVLTLTPAPDAPSLSDPANFQDEAAAYVAWMATAAGEISGQVLQPSDLQSSITDTTSGKGMIVGAFGLGGTAPSITGSISGDPASLTPGVFGYSTSTASGGPSEVTNGTLINLRRGATVGAQIMVADWSGGVIGRIFSRAYVSGAWSEWRTPYTKDNILGPVAQSGGVPTGAVIERGSNANGEYVRLADGTQICTGIVNVTDVAAATGGIYTAAEVTWTFPAAFSTTAGLSCHGGGVRSVGSLWSRVRANSASSGVARVFSSLSLTGTFTVEVSATGRWF